MRKSIDVEGIFSTIANEKLAKSWKVRIDHCLEWLAMAPNSTNKLMSITQLKEELEFAKANIELLSEEDYKWLLEQEKSPTIESKKSKKSLTIDSPEFKEALANAPFVCKTHDNSDTEVMDKFKKVATKFTATTKALTDAISKPKVGNKEVSESRSTRWLVQIIKGKDIYYRTLRTANRMSPSILDAKCYVSENAAKQAIVSVVAENADNEAMYFWKIEAKEVLCTESSSRTIELVNSVVEAVEIPDDEKFVLWSNGSNEFFVQIDSTGVRTTKNLDEATKYVSYKSASQAVKKTDKEFPYRFSISTVKNVKPFVLPVEKPVTKAQVRARKPKIKEEWVLYINEFIGGKPVYYSRSAEIKIPNYKSTYNLEDAMRFPSYGAATKAKCKLIKAGFITLEVANVEDCK